MKSERLIKNEMLADSGRCYNGDVRSDWSSSLSKALFSGNTSLENFISGFES